MSGVTRRELFRFWRQDPPARREPERDPLRPPGAIFESLLVDTCARCGKCVEVCPRDAIVPLDESFGRAAGTPAIRPRSAPCVVCEGLACTQVCPSGALRKIAVFDVQMGTAVVRPSCVTYHGQPCAECIAACPVPGAIAPSDDGHPHVDAARCIGCGVCEHVCPTASASIVVEPAREILR